MGERAPQLYVRWLVVQQAGGRARSAHLPLVDPKKIVCPVQIIRGEHDRIRALQSTASRVASTN
jgi:hypothetical protein